MNNTDEVMKDAYDADLFDNAEVGKYAQRLRQASNVVVVEPDIAAAFPNNEAVNSALRQILKLTQQVNRSKPA